MESDSITESFFYVEDVMEAKETIYKLIKPETQATITAPGSALLYLKTSSKNANPA